MSFEVAGGPRLEAAVEELVGVLDALDDGALFNLVFFATDVRAWRQRPVVLDGQSRADARAFARAQKARGYTAIYEALELAFRGAEVDTIYLLSDGVPEGGALVDVDQILAEVERWNSTQHIRVHAVSLAGENDLLRRLAGLTGGRFVIAG